MKVTGTRTTIETNVVVDINPQDVLKRMLDNVFKEENIGRGYFDPSLRIKKGSTHQLQIEEEHHTSHSWYSWEDFGDILSDEQLITFNWAKETWGRLKKYKKE